MNAITYEQAEVDNLLDESACEALENFRGLVCREYNPPLDKGIARFVDVLSTHEVETYESCEGGEGHAYLEPTIRFHGERGEGFRALGIALNHRLPVKELRRLWVISDGEPASATWEIVFWNKEA